MTVTGEGHLAGYPGLDGLLVARRPLAAPPVDIVVVNAPWTWRNGPEAGLVRIQHLATTGHNELVDAPVADAVPLFWRFMIEKFGVDSGWDGG